MQAAPKQHTHTACLASLIQGCEMHPGVCRQVLGHENGNIFKEVSAGTINGFSPPLKFVLTLALCSR